MPVTEHSVRMCFIKKVGAVVQIEHNNAYADYWYAIDSNWTTRRYANSGIANSRTGELANWTTHSLVDAAGSSTCCFN